VQWFHLGHSLALDSTFFMEEKEYFALASKPVSELLEFDFLRRISVSRMGLRFSFHAYAELIDGMVSAKVFTWRF